MRRLSESGLSAFKASFVCTYRGLKQPKTSKKTINIIGIMLTALMDKGLKGVTLKN